MDEDYADRFPLVQHGNGQHRPARPTYGARNVTSYREPGIVMHIGDVDHGAVEDGSAGGRLWVGSPRIEALQKCATLWWEVATRYEVLTFAIKPVRVSPCTITEAYCTVDDCVENWLHISRGLADHAQDLARRRLLLQQLAQVAVPRLQLLEQPHVLDRDDRLVGEGLQERKVAVGEPAWLQSRDSNHTDRYVIAHHRHVNETPEASRPTYVTLVLSDGRVCLDVAHRRRRSLAHRSRRHRHAVEKNGMEVPHNCIGGGACRVVGHQLQLIVHEASHGDRVPVQK